MKLHIISDLHLEFAQFQPHSASFDADVIVLAGDIWKGANGLFWAREQWPSKPIIYVAGNHEFYGFQRKNVLSECRLAAKETGVHFLDDDEVIIDGVRFLGSTLWTDFKLFGDQVQRWAMKAAMTGLNDFRVIHEGTAVFSPNDALNLFDTSYAYLKQKLDDETFEGKTVVITHHLPSIRSVAERYREDMLSACFASNLDHLFGRSELWIHGHTHDSFDYSANRTRVVCNPRGYALYNRDVENANFDPALIVEI